MHYRIILRADGIPHDFGPQGAIDIEDNFKHRPWHHNIKCDWNAQSHSMVLQAENDYDEKGMALMDEFSDELSACLKDVGQGSICVISVTEFSHLES